MISRFLPLLALLSGSALDASSVAADVGAGDLAERRAWLERADEGDYFFWKRFFDRLDNPGEFPQPPRYYNPQTLVVGAPGAPLPGIREDDRRFGADAAARLDAYLRSQDTGAFYLVREGQVEHAYFAGDVHAGSLLPVRSITKSLLALLVGVAIADGHLAGLEEPVGRYLPEWRGDGRGALKIRDLLEMSSGLEYVPLRPEPGNRALQLAEGSDVDAAALSWKIGDPPGRTFSINQVDSQLLGMILQRATGMPLDRYLSEKLWRPLGLGPATLNVDAAGRIRAFCCMRIVAMDLLKIGVMLAQGGVWEGRRIVPREWIERMQQPSRASPDVGLHVFLGRNTGKPEPDNPYRPAAELLRAPGVFYFQGGLSIILWVVPTDNVVLFRWGFDRKGWDMSRIPNIVLDELARTKSR